MRPSDIFTQARAARLGEITRIPICSSHAEPRKFTQNSISPNKQFQTLIKHMIMQSNHYMLLFYIGLSNGCLLYLHVNDMFLPSCRFMRSLLQFVLWRMILQLQCLFSICHAILDDDYSTALITFFKCYKHINFVISISNTFKVLQKILNSQYFCNDNKYANT